jgi:hypothetical protein
VAEAAAGTWDAFRKERDLHRMHHKRVAQEKNRLITDIRRLKVICAWLTRKMAHVLALVHAMPCSAVQNGRAASGRLIYT